MIKINFHRGFLKEFDKLPRDIKTKLASLEKVFLENPFSTQLHVKMLKGSFKTFLSFRVTRDYRVIFRFVSSGEVDFLSVRHRKDVYK